MPLIWLLIALLLPLPSAAREYRGEVVAVTDGDTLIMKARNNRRMVIRLADIDAPEKRQPYGMEAMRVLMELASGQAIVVDKRTNDKYSRTVGTVYRAGDDLNLNRELMRRGDAWAYRAYLEDAVILALEQTAEERRIGLWSQPPEDRIAPWEWRRMHKLNR